MADTFKILLVDDEGFFRETLASYLEGEIEDDKPIFNVVSAENFESAISKMKENIFDGVILDLRFPEHKDKEAKPEAGAKLLEIMNVNPATSDAAIIILTAYATVDRAVNLTRRGAYEFIQKPVDPEYLARILRLAIERSKLQKRVDELTIDSIKTGVVDAILHNINNDLNKIVGEAEYVRDKLLVKILDGDWKDELHKYMDHIINMAMHASGSAVSKMFQKEMVRDKVDIYKILKRCVEYLKKDYHVKGITLLMPEDEDIPLIESYPETVMQALYPLIENAYEAVPANGTIRLSTNYDIQEKIVEIQISDNGPGMNQDQIKLALTGGYSTKGGCHGFGLKISSRLLEEIFGSLKINSEPGKGTTITVALPSLEDII